jgi:uncharacterized protein YkwD
MRSLLRAMTLLAAVTLALPANAQVAALGPTAGPIEFRATDAAAMVSMIRRSYGLGPVGVDRRLMNLAQQQADAMAQADLMSHSVAGSFAQRIPRSYAVAAENIAAGSWSLEQTMQLWEDSPGHLHNMLINQVTDIGIGYAYSPRSQRYYFALILAAPL